MNKHTYFVLQLPNELQPAHCFGTPAIKSECRCVFINTQTHLPCTMSSAMTQHRLGSLLSYSHMYQYMSDSVSARQPRSTDCSFPSCSTRSGSMVHRWNTAASGLKEHRMLGHSRQCSWFVLGFAHLCHMMCCRQTTESSRCRCRECLAKCEIDQEDI